MNATPQTLREAAALTLRLASDEVVQRPLWTFRPHAVKAVLHERRRRFGIEDERISPAELTEEGDTEFRVSDE